ncbi:hypothetical protein AB0C02_22950 [Micromonospora sp. NPDC048999]|uniref:hypothetical protein n=1 Tax=Micromonospora sp. NPDC048999 TaxID=3155391 RepID=UPI0033EE510B
MTTRLTRTIATVLALMAASFGVMLAGTAPASAGTATSYTVTRESSTFDGGCYAKATVTYYPGSDTAHFETMVTSPYWFAACRVNTHLYVQGKSTQWTSAVHFAMACAVGDPTCSSTQTRIGDYQSCTPSLTAYVDSVNDALAAAGQPRTYTRTQAAESISIAFTKA